MKALVAALLLLSMVAAAQSTIPSPAQKAIAAAQERILKDPKLSQGYTELAIGLIRRGRETGDPDYYQRADRALQDSFRLEPEDRKSVV